MKCDDADYLLSSKIKALYLPPFFLMFIATLFFLIDV